MGEGFVEIAGSKSLQLPGQHGGGPLLGYAQAQKRLGQLEQVAAEVSEVSLIEGAAGKQPGVQLLPADGSLGKVAPRQLAQLGAKPDEFLLFVVAGGGDKIGEPAPVGAGEGAQYEH